MAKYVIAFSPDYFATSLWARNDAAKELGTYIEYSDLPLSSELKKHLRKFDNWAFSMIDWDDPGAEKDNLPYEEHKALFETGKKLLEMVRQELGEDFEVLDELDWIDPAKRYDQKGK